MSAAIVLDGWTLDVRGVEPRVRDVDLADKAGLAKARDIRATIRKAIEDGGLTEVKGGAAAAGTPAGTPIAWSEDETVSGNKTTAYYLNEEGALLVLTRLRTKVAVAATRSLVTVCAAARRGELAPVHAPTPPAPPVRLLPEKTAICFEAARLLGEPNMVALFGPDLARTKAEHFLAEGTGKEPQGVAPRMLTAAEYLTGKGVRPAAVRAMAPQLGKLVKAAYQRRHGKAPPQVERFVDGATRDVCGYTETDRPLFDEAYALLGARATGVVA